MEIPPVSKHTPLPTNAKGASSPPPFHSIVTTADSRMLPWPTPRSAPIPKSSISSSVKTETVKPISLSRSHLSAKVAGYRMFAGSEDRSRAKCTPLAIAFTLFQISSNRFFSIPVISKCTSGEIVFFLVKYLLNS